MARLSLIAVIFCLTVGPAMAAKDTTKCDARILNQSVVYKVSKNGKARFEGSVRLVVYNEDGKKYGHAAFGDSQFMKLKRFDGRVLDAGGNIIYELDKDDGARYCGFAGYELYSDICTWSFTLSSGAFPYTVEYEFSIDHKSLFYWPPWAPMWAIPVEESVYELVIPNTCAFTTKTIGEIDSAEITNESDNRRYRWVKKDIPAFPGEDYSYEETVDRLALWFAPQQFKHGRYDHDGSTWNNLAAGCFAMFRDQLELEQPQQTFAEQVFAGATGPLAKCRLLHDALLQRSRYVAIEIGIGGWEPSPAKETFTRGYGDCKDLSTMYIAMLRHAGITAKPALLMTRNEGWTDPDFPKRRFNHVILFTIIDNDTVWTDPTCQSCAVGDLLWYDENISVLALDSASGGIVQTPHSTPEENAVIRSGELELTQKSSVACYLTLTALGNSSHWLQRRLEGTEKKEIDDLLKNSTYGLPERFVPDAMSIVSNELGRSNVALRLSGIVRNAKQSIGQKHYIDIDILDLFTKPELVDLTERELGIELQYPRSFLDTLTVRIPPGWKALEIPEDVFLEDDFGSLAITHTFAENRFIIVREKKSYPYRIHPDQLAAFAAHMTAFKEAVPKYLVLEEE